METNLHGKGVKKGMRKAKGDEAQAKGKGREKKRRNIDDSLKRLETNYQVLDEVDAPWLLLFAFHTRNQVLMGWREFSARMAGVVIQATGGDPGEVAKANRAAGCFATGLRLHMRSIACRTAGRTTRPFADRGLTSTMN